MRTVHFSQIRYTYVAEKLMGLFLDTFYRVNPSGIPVYVKCVSEQGTRSLRVRGEPYPSGTLIS